MFYSLSPNFLQADPSIRILAQKKIPDSLINKWVDCVSRMNIGNHLETYYSNTIKTQDTCHYVEIRDATAIYLPLPNGETRAFLFSSDGLLLLEPSVNRVFLRCFPIFANITKNSLDLLISPEVFKSAIIDRIDYPIYWSPENSNYLHFIADTVAPHLCINGSLYGGVSDSRHIISLNCPLHSWQRELLSLIGLSQDPRLLAIYLQNKGRPYAVRYSCIYLPVVESVPYRIHTFRNFIKEYSIDSGINTFSRRSEPPPLLFLDRNDNRSRRIANKSEIISHLSHYGLRVVNPVSLSLRQKLQYFSGVRIFIAEGSSSANFMFFSQSSSSMILLADDNLYVKPEFIIGGWPYFIATLANTLIVRGLKYGIIPGSPMASSTYPSIEINGIVQDIINN